MLVPRFYRTIFENGICEIRYTLRKDVAEIFQPFVTLGSGATGLSCEDVLVVAKHESPIQAEVLT